MCFYKRSTKFASNSEKLQIAHKYSIHCKPEAKFHQIGLNDLVKIRCSLSFSAYHQAVRSETDWSSISARHFLQADFVKHAKDMHFKSKVIIDGQRRRRHCIFSLYFLQPHKTHDHDSQRPLTRQTPTRYEQFSLSTFKKKINNNFKKMLV